MNHFSVDPEEMAKRTDKYIDAILRMIGEGSPVYDSYPSKHERIFERPIEHKAPKELPETYQ